jgi:1-acyl-sn-glycerol-3-phosphate acyltransferase
MSLVRALARAVALGCWTALAGAQLALVARDPRAQARLLQRWARGVARVIGLRIAVAGEVPSGTFLLVANHLSYLDVVVLGALLEGTFVAKADVAAWPVAGPLCRAAGTLFVDRARKRDLLRVLPLVEQELRAGRSVVLFPEGTTSDGTRVLRFRSPLFEAAVRARTPARVASLTYALPEGGPHPSETVCWWGDMPFGPHLVALLRQPRIAAHVAFHPAPLVGDDRKLLARRARAAARRAFRPVTRGELPCPTVRSWPSRTSASSRRAPS